MLGAFSSLQDCLGSFLSTVQEAYLGISNWYLMEAGESGITVSRAARDKMISTALHDISDTLGAMTIVLQGGESPVITIREYASELFNKMSDTRLPAGLFLSPLSDNHDDMLAQYNMTQSTRILLYMYSALRMLTRPIADLIRALTSRSREDTTQQAVITAMEQVEQDYGMLNKSYINMCNVLLCTTEPCIPVTALMHTEGYADEYGCSMSRDGVVTAPSQSVMPAAEQRCAARRYLSRVSSAVESSKSLYPNVTYTELVRHYTQAQASSQLIVRADETIAALRIQLDTAAAVNNKLEENSSKLIQELQIVRQNVEELEREKNSLECVLNKRDRAMQLELAFSVSPLSAPAVTPAVTPLVTVMAPAQPALLTQPIPSPAAVVLSAAPQPHPEVDSEALEWLQDDTPLIDFDDAPVPITRTAGVRAADVFDMLDTKPSAKPADMKLAPVEQAKPVINKTAEVIKIVEPVTSKPVSKPTEPKLVADSQTLISPLLAPSDDRIEREKQLHWHYRNKLIELQRKYDELSARTQSTAVPQDDELHRLTQEVQRWRSESSGWESEAATLRRQYEELTEKHSRIVVQLNEAITDSDMLRESRVKCVACQQSNKIGNLISTRCRCTNCSKLVNFQLASK